MKDFSSGIIASASVSLRPSCWKATQLTTQRLAGRQKGLQNSFWSALTPGLSPDKNVVFNVIYLALQKTERLQHFSHSLQLWFGQTFLPLSFAGWSLSPCHVIPALITGLNSATNTERLLLWDPCCTLNCLQMKGCLTPPARQENGSLVWYKQAPVSFADKLRQLSPLSFPLHLYKFDIPTKTAKISRAVSNARVSGREENPYNILPSLSTYTRLTVSWTDSLF